MSMTEILTALTSTFYAESQPLVLIFVVKLKASKTWAFRYVCYLWVAEYNLKLTMSQFTW